MGVPLDQARNESAATDEHVNPVDHHERLTNLAAALLGEAGRSVNDIADVRRVVSIMATAVSD